MLEHLAGALEEVRVLALEEKGMVLCESTTGARRSLPLDTILALRALSVGQGGGKSSAAVELKGGSILCGNVTRAEADGFLLTTAHCGQLALSLDDVRCVRFAEATLPASSATDDLLVLQRGSRQDTLPGEVLSITQDGVRFVSAAGERVFHLNKDAVVGVVLREEAESPARPLNPARLVLKDGSVLHGDLLPAAAWSIRLTPSVTALLQSESIQVLEPMSPRFQRLSDAALDLAEPQTLLDQGALPALVRTEGLIGGVWRRALHLRAPAKLGCKWAEGAQTFLARVAVDDEHLARGVQGAVQLCVRADGAMLGEPITLHTRTGSTTLRMAVPPGTKRLELEAGYVGGKVAGARCVILEACMLRP